MGVGGCGWGGGVAGSLLLHLAQLVRIDQVHLQTMSVIQQRQHVACSTMKLLSCVPDVTTIQISFLERQAVYISSPPSEALVRCALASFAGRWSVVGGWWLVVSGRCAAGGGRWALCAREGLGQDETIPISNVYSMPSYSCDCLGQDETIRHRDLLFDLQHDCIRVHTIADDCR